MGIKIMYDRLRTVKGMPVYEILAKTKESNNSFFVVYRETLDGKRTYRNLDYRLMAGYLVYGAPEKRMHQFWNNRTPEIMCLDQTAYECHIKPLLNYKPDFIYTFKKCGTINLVKTWHAFKTWLKHPKMEILLNMGFFTLANDNNFLNMKESRQKEIINFYLAHEDKNATKIAEKRHSAISRYIMGAMKNNCSYVDYKNYIINCRRHFLKNLDYKSYKKLVNKNIPLYDFMWYRDKLKRNFPERIKDSYWTTFKDVDDFFMKEKTINDQIDNRRKLEAAEQRKKQAISYKKAIRKYCTWDCTFNGLHVYIPTNIKDIEKQAKTLNQCLIDNDYISEVINKKLILAFIRKDDIPLATASLEGKELTLGQFYGNELDRDNCQPTQEYKEALNMFMDKFIRKSA